MAVPKKEFDKRLVEATKPNQQQKAKGKKTS